MAVAIILRALRILGLSLVGAALTIQGQDATVSIYPTAMSKNYNPLLWRGEDAQFALDMLKGSRCTADMSKTIAVKSKNRAVQDLALVMAHDQEKFYRRLRNLARTFDFPLPPKRDYNCPEDSRLAELSEADADTSYVGVLVKRTSWNVTRFEAEVGRPQGPGNATLWSLARKWLPTVRSESEQVKTVNVAMKGHK